MLQPFAAVLAGLMLVGTVAAQTLVVRADHWMPLNGMPDAPRPGFAIEILHHIFGAHDIRVDYQLDSWTRSVRQARNGDIDCVVGAYRGEAPDLMYPQQPLGYDETAFYVLSEDAWRYQGVESLEGQRLGVIDGYNYGTPLDEWLATPEGERAAQAIHGREPLKRNLRMLLAGRLDVIVESPFVMQALLRDLGLSEVVRSGMKGQAVRLSSQTVRGGQPFTPLARRRGGLRGCGSG